MEDASHPWANSREPAPGPQKGTAPAHYTPHYNPHCKPATPAGVAGPAQNRGRWPSWMETPLPQRRCDRGVSIQEGQQ